MTDDVPFLVWPADVQAMIEEVQTVEGLDVLVCVADEPSRLWTFDALVARVGHDRLPVLEAVAHLVGKGLLEATGMETISYAQQSAATEAAVQELVRLCREDRPNVLGAIAYVSVWRIRSGMPGAFVARRIRPPTDA